MSPLDIHDETSTKYHHRKDIACNYKKKSSEVAFHEGIDEKCVEIVGTGGPPEYLQ